MIRIQEVKNHFDKKFEAILVSSIPNIIYLTGFAGFSDHEREAFLLLTKRKNYIFTDGRYCEVVKKLNNFQLIEISPRRSFEDGLRKIVTQEKIKTVAIDEHNIKVSELLKIKKAARVCSDQNLIEDLRKAKDKSEIENIKKACKLGDSVFKHILSEIKLGVTEKEIAKKIEVLILQNCAQISFKPIVAFGENSSSPHHVPSARKLKKNEIVLLDFGVEINNYCSDMTRTIFFGKANSKLEKIYKTVLESQTKAIEFISDKWPIVNGQLNVKLKASDIDSASRKHITSHCFPTIPHSLGHGIGLEVHEKPSLSPKSKDVLTNGMVFSVEPGIYIPGFGGVRIEDLILLTAKGPQIITRANREIIEL